mgnify:CR=1 FL=1
MGFLTTITIYNDHLYDIENDPQGFVDQVVQECKDPQGGRFYRNFVPQTPRHADSPTIYVHYENTVFEMNPYSQKTKEMLQYYPELFDKIVDIMKDFTKELEKLNE